MPTESRSDLISFGCPSCGTAIKAKPDMAGRAAKCPKCATGLKVPNTRAGHAQRPAASETSTADPPNPPEPLAAILEMCRKSRDKYWLAKWKTRLKVGSDIPDDWVQRCRKNFGIPPVEELVALVNTAGWIFKGSHGFAITESGVRWILVGHPLWKTLLFGFGRKRAFTWAELAQTPLRFEEGMLNIHRNDIVFGDFFTRFYCGTKYSNKPLYELLLELQEWARRRAS